MPDTHILIVYNFSPQDDNIEQLKFDTKDKMLSYMESLIDSGKSCLYYSESSLPFSNGWEELQSSSHTVFD